MILIDDGAVVVATLPACQWQHVYEMYICGISRGYQWVLDRRTCAITEYHNDLDATRVYVEGDNVYVGSSNVITVLCAKTKARLRIIPTYGNVVQFYPGHVSVSQPYLFEIYDLATSKSIYKYDTYLLRGTSAVYNSVLAYHVSGSGIVVWKGTELRRHLVPGTLPSTKVQFLVVNDEYAFAYIGDKRRVYRCAWRGKEWIPIGPAFARREMERLRMSYDGHWLIMNEENRLSARAPERCALILLRGLLHPDIISVVSRLLL